MSARAREGEAAIIAIENEPLNDVELHELEVVMERHKALREANYMYGVFSSLCIPRLLVTIRELQRESAHVRKERDDALALLRNLTG
jgi:hypothetical protein